jgi:hypothetical protein
MDFEKYKQHCPFPAAEKFQETLLAYLKERAQLDDLFKIDALAEVGLAKHPKAERAFKMAWTRGHRQGYSAVLEELQELATLLLED